MKKMKLLYLALILISVMTTSCSKEDVCDSAGKDGKYIVSISYPSTRAMMDQVQGGGKYSDGETVSLYTTGLKFTAEANGSAGGTWLSDMPQSRVTLTSGINQDWSVTIKDFYCDVTFDNTALGGDGTTETVAMKFGEQLPTPIPASGYTFEGWYDGSINIKTVPDSSNKTLTAKYLKPKIIMVSGNNILTPEGVQIINNHNWYSVAYGNGKYVAISWEGYVTLSTDGVTWSTPIDLSPPVGVAFQKIKFCNNRFYIVGMYSYVASSIDGISWSKIELPKADKYLREIVYGNGRYIIPSLFSSTDGMNWDSSSMTEIISSIAYGKELFVGISQNSKFLMTTSDGLKWTNLPSLGLDYIWNSIAYGKERFVLVGKGKIYGSIATSEDGEKWDKNYGDERIEWIHVAYGFGMFVVTGKDAINAYMITSIDGKNWSEPTKIAGIKEPQGICIGEDN